MFSAVMWLSSFSMASKIMARCGVIHRPWAFKVSIRESIILLYEVADFENSHKWDFITAVKPSQIKNPKDFENPLGSG
jgi:hypothetical protein